MINDERYKMLVDSFNKSLQGDWRGNPPVESDFRKLFDEMAPKLSEIEFNDCIVDISVMRQWLDFNLFCPDDLMITACRVVGQEDDSVMYSVSHHKTTLMIHHNQTVDSLVDAANKAIKLVSEEKVTETT
jgi:hypothetical protein